MTPLQKSFAVWCRDFSQLCQDWGGKASADTNGGSWHKFEFKTRLGNMSALVMDSDYESQKKRGSVWIYMKFAHEVNAKAIEKELWGDFNYFSGKWNFYKCGGPSDVQNTRSLALTELTRRFSHVKACAI